MRQSEALFGQLRHLRSEKIGLVGREVDQRGARLVIVTATDAGMEKLSEALVRFAKRAAYLFDDRWNDKEVDQFAVMLRRLIAGTGDTLV
ncbi:hypothetical protein A8B78_13745 [Jannaschia sp. EhC01]|nr:hypothetical protein A8B78_13745 [Jannaschia sp. EhC01]